MDLGLFRRSKTAFWAWVILPGALVAVVLYVVHVYCSYVDEVLQRRLAFDKLLPDLTHRVAMARDVMAGCSLMPKGESLAAEALSAKLNDAAQRCGFVINSVRVDKVEPEGKTKLSLLKKPAKTVTALPALQVTVQGEGLLAAIVKLVAEVQGPQTLVTVESAKVRAKRLIPEPMYEGEFVFVCYGVPK
jgi:hypothetical protein